MKDTHTLKKQNKKKHALKKITEKNFCINPVGEIFFFLILNFQSNFLA